MWLVTKRATALVAAALGYRDDHLDGTPQLEPASGDGLGAVVVSTWPAGAHQIFSKQFGLGVRTRRSAYMQGQSVLDLRFLTHASSTPK